MLSAECDQMLSAERVLCVLSVCCVQMLRSCSADRLRRAGMSRKDAERVHVALLLSWDPEVSDLTPNGPLVGH